MRLHKPQSCVLQMDILIRQVIKNPNFKNVTWFLTGIFVVIVMGMAIAYGEWKYLAILSIPLLMYLSIEKPFIFPFGVYLFLIPFDSILSVTGSSKGTTLTKLLGIVTILILLLKGSFERKLQWPDKAAFYWTLFVLLGLVSIAWAMRADSVKSISFTAVGLLALYFVISSYKMDGREFETCKWFILFGGGFCSIYAVYSYAAGIFYESTTRATIALDERTTDPNHFAFSLLIPISLSIEKIFGQKSLKMKTLLIAVLGLMIFSVIISGSRGGLLGVLIIFLLYAFLIKKRFLLLTLMVLMGIVLLELAPDYFFERVEGVADSGGAGRMTIWIYGISILKQNWLYGVGLNNFPMAYSEFAHFTPFTQAIYRGAHNQYLQVLVELGIIGFTVMTVSIVAHYKTLTLKGHNPDIGKTMLKASLCGILVTSFYLDTIWTKSFWLLWMMILIHRNVKERRNTLYETRMSPAYNR